MGWEFEWHANEKRSGRNGCAWYGRTNEVDPAVELLSQELPKLFTRHEIAKSPSAIV